MKTINPYLGERCCLGFICDVCFLSPLVSVVFLQPAYILRISDTTHVWRGARLFLLFCTFTAQTPISSEKSGCAQPRTYHPPRQQTTHRQNWVWKDPGYKGTAGNRCRPGGGHGRTMGECARNKPQIRSNAQVSFL